MKGYESKKLMKQTTCENAAKELTAQNGAAALGYADENMWFSEKPDYAACVRELIETVREQEIRAFVPEEYWTLTTPFAIGDAEVVARFRRSRSARSPRCTPRC